MDSNGNGIDGGDTTIIQTGSHLNVVSFLSTHMPNSRALVSYTGDFQGVEVLKGKVVMLCCFSLPMPMSSYIAWATSLASPELYALGCFKLVIVVNVSCVGHDAFNEFLSGFPSFCLVVPYEDCDAICRALKFASGSEPTGVLVNRSNRVVWRQSLEFFLEYGVDAFPFTPEKLARVTEVENSINRKKTRHSLEYFLCPCPLFLPSPHKFDKSAVWRHIIGDCTEEPQKICFECLDHMCVGLYLCQTGNLIPTLDKIYKECCDYGFEFEVILVYMPSYEIRDPQLFQDRINATLVKRNISWQALPFDYSVSRRLWHICQKNAHDRLIIIDPKSTSVELHGEVVIRRFGIDAYPFSRQELLNRELKRLGAVTLESLLVYSSRDCVLRMGAKVPVAKLRGRKVILYLHCEGTHSDTLCLHLHQMKALDPSFDIVFVGKDASFSASLDLFAIPWFACHFDQEHSCLVWKTLFREDHKQKRSTLVAFGSDGRISSLRAQHYIKEPSFYPFNKDNLHHEIKTELFGRKGAGVCCL